MSAVGALRTTESAGQSDELEETSWLIHKCPGAGRISIKNITSNGVYQWFTSPLCRMLNRHFEVEPRDPTI